MPKKPNIPDIEIMQICSAINIFQKYKQQLDFINNETAINLRL